MKSMNNLPAAGWGAFFAKAIAIGGRLYPGSVTTQSSRTNPFCLSLSGVMEVNADHQRKFAGAQEFDSQLGVSASKRRSCCASRRMN